VAEIGRISKALVEATGILRRPQRALLLIHGLAADGLRSVFDKRSLYSYTTTKRDSGETLKLLLHWILEAQRADGGVAAYYSLLTGYAPSYPEVTGYLIPTLYDLAHHDPGNSALAAAQQATQWLLSLQLPTGAFPGGFYNGVPVQPSVFNTGQILHGLVRTYRETGDHEIRRAAVAAGDWLVEHQQPDGSWSGPGAYQEQSHTYYSMVAWALAELSEPARDRRYSHAADKNLDWVLSHFELDGWINGINLQGHPNYLHFVAYVIQGVLECGILLRREDAIEAAAKSAWVLLRKFEARHSLPGAFGSSFKTGDTFACLTGNAQMSCVWLRLFEKTRDLRYLNAGLKINEMLKRLIPMGGPRGIAGGVSGSYPIWGTYQPLRYISWGCKFLADALLLEQHLRQSFVLPVLEVLPCAS
jgi:hypothetical protein